MPLPEQSYIQPIMWTESTPSDNRKTVTNAGTAERLVAASLKVKWVVIQAEDDNTDAIAVGASSVVATAGSCQGTILFPSNTVTLYGVDLTNIYINSRVNGEGANFFYGT